MTTIPRINTKKTTLSALIALLVHAPVIAQTDQADQAAAENEAVLEEVIVTGVRASLDTAAEIKPLVQYGQRGAEQFIFSHKQVFGLLSQWKKPPDNVQARAD